MRNQALGLSAFSVTSAVQMDQCLNRRGRRERREGLMLDDYFSAITWLLSCSKPVSVTR
jgi:hypothetical protein